MALFLFKEKYMEEKIIIFIDEETLTKEELENIDEEEQEFESEGVDGY